MTRGRRFLVILAGSLSAAALLGFVAADKSAAWSADELATIGSLSLAELPPVPPDPSNRVAHDPKAAELGKALFSDARFSANGKVACATCHVPQRQFQDDRPLAKGIGETARRTMPLAGAAHFPFLFWDGRKDSLWSQALGPLESAVEHGGDRTQYAHLISAHYRARYESVFGPLPATEHLPAHAAPVDDPATRRAWDQMTAADRDNVNRVFANMGKAIAAYERGIQPPETRFDRYAAALLAGKKPVGDAAMTRSETDGLRLFIGKANCINCHNGPLLTNGDFHNTGVPFAPHGETDTGRAAGVSAVKNDIFNCLGPYSDAGTDDCSELRFMPTEGENLVRSFKTPSLRGAATRAPYMHAGQITTLADVVAHYDRAAPAPAGHTEIRPLSLSAKERDALVAFLKTLSDEPHGEQTLTASATHAPEEN